MPISFGRREESAETDPVAPSKGVGKRLMGLGDKGFTGAVHIGVKGVDGANARIFMFDGGAYAVELDGYAPVIMDRLLADGTLDLARWKELGAIFGPHRPDPRVGVAAVQQDWLAVEDLVNIHQEYLLASFGAVIAHPKVKVDERAGETTAGFCSLPQEIPRLLRLVQGRQQKLDNAWRGMGATGSAASIVLTRTGNTIPDNLFVPKFASMIEAIDGARSLDGVAEVIGFTRAETVRLASLLLQVDVVRIDDARTPEIPTDRLLVPEAFGNPITSRPAAPVDREPPVPVRPPVPEPVREAAPEPEPVPAPEAVPEPEPAPEPVPEAVPEAVPEPVPVPEPAPEPEPVRKAEPVPAAPPAPAPPPPPAPEPIAAPAPRGPATDRGRDHVRQLRLEVATEEAAELEELLHEAIAAEHEALTRTAIIRERLREALTVIAELSGSADAVPEQTGRSAIERQP